MEKIESFKVNHLNLKAGLYLSRKDYCSGVTVSTFDLRFTAPNIEPVIDQPALHTIEHLGATFLRNSDVKEQVIYFGPMGCRTGFYLVVFGDKKPTDMLKTVVDMCDYIIGFTGEIPGASPVECGNYLEQNLDMAKYYAEKYKKNLLELKNFEYKD